MSSFVAVGRRGNSFLLMFNNHSFLRQGSIMKLCPEPVSKRPMSEWNCRVMESISAATLYLDFGRSATVVVSA